MNRITFVLITVLSTVLPSFAQFVHTGPGDVELVNTNFTGVFGANFGSAAFVQGATSLKVISSELTGANGGGGTDATAYGGFGLLVVATPETRIDGGSQIHGGSGEDIVPIVSFSSDVNIYGGVGAGLVGTTLGDKLIISNATVSGGSGGSIVNAFDSTKSIFAYGGHGVVNQGGRLELHDGAQVSGGNGGDISSSGAVLTSPTSIYGGVGIQFRNSAELEFSGQAEVSGGNGGTFTGDAGTSAVIANASGGAALEFVDLANSMTVTNGSYTGGNGGIVQGAEGSIALGGAGARVADSADVTLAGGTYTGGIGGGVDGSKQADGDAVEIFNSTVTLSGGTFVGDIHVTGDAASSLTMSGGDFSGDLLISGSGTSALSFQNTLTNFTSLISQTSGTANINQWGNSHFANIKIFGGTMNFNNQGFTNSSGSSIALMGQGSVVDFKVGLLAKSNSLMTISFDGTDSTVVKGGALTFEEGAKWIIDGGDNAVATGQQIVMAEGSSLSASTNTSYVMYEGSGGSWMGGITSLARTSTRLTGTYGYVPIEVALDLDPDSEFGKAMTDLSDLTDIADTGDDEYVDLKALSEDAATATLADGYVRAPEMASTLIQLQGLFADQIKDRTRSHLRQQNWGGTTASAPQGAQGPGWDSSMDWLNDHLPKWDAREAVKKDNPPKTGKVHSPKAPREKITLPATYQVWGRAYGSTLEQDATTGFAGYKANIGGGVLGLDKRFNNMLLGLGGGYAHTTVDGNWGSDGEADTVYGTVYTAIMGEKTFLDLNVNYAFNDVETESSSIMKYSGDYKASTASFYLGGGLGLDWGSVLFTPEVSLLTTYYDRESYTETSSADDFYSDKEWDSFSEWSYLSSLGATFSMVRHIESLNLEMEFRPEVRVHWLHEFNAEMDNPTYLQVGGVNTIGVSLQAREEDLIKVGTGVRFAKWNSDTLEFGLDIDGAFGQDYAAYIISGKLMHRF